ncbi:uncharacterized protein Z518_03103 [Rhinocladiella mackenziei CBS 650.93]|uniref:DUF6594 domain-containing protein n=1 Tax=Rhinocladiella mackenziei CBS 650.93 TaxID=1442369 RepID=A0A0D2G1S3_9EURO|nr:uncharacterized protein Z518_03103 [Rhinocladiella mackenziei CBS 650.93]KIX08447.1 hypothetical protein Z518_03103 [Rhinocladiella mackenziei CBS 650.93]
MEGRTDGYQALSALMGTFPEFSIFRKFSILNCQDLLLLQAQLIQKEGQFLSLMAEERASNDEAGNNLTIDFEAIMDPQNATDGCAKRQREKLLEMREGLLRFHQLETSLPSAHKPALERLRRFLKSGPNRRTFLHDRHYFTWAKKNEYDLTSVAAKNTSNDALSQWFSWFVTDVYHKHWGHERHEHALVVEEWRPRHTPGLTYYPERTIANVVTAVSTILAPVLPTMSALGLYFITDPLLRLGVLVIVSFLFSGALALVGVPRKVDSFTATATFTAVLIVFVGNNTDCTC